MPARTPAENDQVRKDRRALLKGTLMAGAAGAGAIALLRKGAGGIVRHTPSYPGGSAGLPAPQARVPCEPKITRSREVIRLAGPPAPRKPTALDNQTRKGGVPRAMRAADLREQRAYAALKPTTPAKLARGNPADRATFAKLDARARSAKAKDQGGLVTPHEQATADRGVRRRARQDLLKFRKQKNFMTPASPLIRFGERSSTARDVAVGVGALAVGGSAIHAVREIAPRFTPQEIGRAIGADVRAKTRKTLKGYFPTFTKAGKKVSVLMRRHVFDARDQKPEARFQTPATALFSGILSLDSVFSRAPREFGNDEQWKEAGTRRYGDPLKGAAGMQRGFFRKNANGDPIVEDIPLAHAQVLKSAYHKGKKIQRTASRGGALAKDVVNVVRGKPREKDAAGRTKKREWEKSWFKNGVRDVAAGGAVLGGAAYLRGNPNARAAVLRAGGKVGDMINRVIPDAVKRHHFATPASGLFGKAEKAVRQTRFGKFLGPSARAVKVQAQREALGRRLAKVPSKEAARVRRKVVRDAALKKDVIHNATAAQKTAFRGARRGAAIAGSGAVLGAAATKAYADQPEKSKVQQGARVRNTLVGAAAGSFLGAGLHGGKSGYRGARVGAALGALSGLVANPKRKQVIEELPTASFGEKLKTETLKAEMWDAEKLNRVERDGQELFATCHEVGPPGGGIKTETLKAEMKSFQTPAARLLLFDAVASDAGWDVRDPRGKSARVFAPGSRARVRRPKEWHEKTENERKLWKAGLVAAGVAGLAGGAAIGRHFPKRPKAVVESAADKVVRGPWKKSG